MTALQRIFDLLRIFSRSALTAWHIEKFCSSSYHLCAQTLLSNLDETDQQRELTREAYDRMSKNLERDEQIAYVACAKAHATWKAIGMGVATKCLSWINTLNLATHHELEPSPRHA